MGENAFRRNEVNDANERPNSASTRRNGRGKIGEIRWGEEEGGMGSLRRRGAGHCTCI